MEKEHKSRRQPVQIAYGFWLYLEKIFYSHILYITLEEYFHVQV